jgi:hypothetical protein
MSHALALVTCPRDLAGLQAVATATPGAAQQAATAATAATGRRDAGAEGRGARPEGAGGGGEAGAAGRVAAAAGRERGEGPVKFPEPQVQTLANGLELVVLEDHEVPRVRVSVIVKAG